jgi:tetratricopeptide (TPR) repeat protein
MRNYYQVLDIDSSADENAIGTAFNEKTSIEMPLEDLRLLTQATQTLLNPKLRREHDVYVMAETHAKKGYFRSAIELLQENIIIKNDEYWLLISSYLTQLNFFAQAISVLKKEVKKRDDNYWRALTQCCIAIGCYHSSRYRWAQSITAYQDALTCLENTEDKTLEDFKGLLDICRSMKEYKVNRCGSAFFSLPPEHNKHVPRVLPEEKKESGCVIC